jgi:PKD repeat protein
MEEWTFTATATDPDIPANTLTFSLVGAPEGASINPSTGVFTWTPSEAQGPGTYTFNVTVSDGSLTDEKEITVTVNEVNLPPVLTLPSLSFSINWGEQLTFTATATDPDIPANTLTFSLVGAPEGASINPSTGAFTWTPSSSQIGTYTFNVTVSDSSLTDEKEITVTVQKRPTTINYFGDTSGQYSDNATLIATLTDQNGTALAGKTLTFTINGSSTTAVTNDTGVATGYTILDKAPGNYKVNASFPGDDCYLPSFNDDKLFHH